MTKIRLRTVDAFTDEAFAGNPAAVVVLDSTPEETWMAALAREMNLSETAFVIREQVPDADYRLRWFTPKVEVDLCGHATLASAHCLFEDGITGPIRFATRSGILTVEHNADGSLGMSFPASPPVETEERQLVSDALGVPVQWTGCVELGGFLLAVLQDERLVRDLRPDLSRIEELKRPLIVTAVADEGSAYDFVSRVFAPTLGIDEDPVTGSSHTLLAPFWAHQLGPSSLRGFQASQRGGSIGVDLVDDRVIISGRAVTVLDGTLNA